MIDIDGNKYNTIEIGNQIWLAENLRVTHFKNGDPVPIIEEDKEWRKAGDEKSAAACVFQNKAANGKIYGTLYNYSAAIDSRGLAPEGWHIPTEQEWEELELFLGKSNTGLKLKATDGWYRKENGTNESGFNGLPGGERSWNGYSDRGDLKRFGVWYSADINQITGVQLTWDSKRLTFCHTDGEGGGKYIRCIKNK